MKRLLYFSFVLLMVAPARAEVKSSAAHAIVIEHTITSTASPPAVYRAFGQIGKWWSGRHTFSGSARNLSLKVSAGQCFCERWKSGSVEHGRVIQTHRDRLLRLAAALGPLLATGVTGVLSFELEPRPATDSLAEGTDLRITYRISGDPSHDLAALGAPIDRVIGEQAARLVRFGETGKPE